jgi:hypothetical protein
MSSRRARSGRAVEPGEDHGVLLHPEALVPVLRAFLG